ncbi:HypC/HybG/HupF family hydrogenase formation chaperone [Actinomadura logoneensis]|uniref:HypC/HybG/HupF family hydrogenase formation chaperone n=1 Tax=Actinomadura logoneensis TaxID=2293572 RepID=UPI001313ED7E|nr:HypC/HybG/HupF family hydrogenase formation chaperone [Actinomadura logoneensis]
MEQVGRVVRIDDGTAVVVRGEARTGVSLVILDMEGVSVATGDWLVVHTGIAVRKISAAEAAELAAELAAERDGTMGRDT